MEFDHQEFKHRIKDDYVGSAPPGTMNVDYAERINMDRMRNYRLDRTKEKLEESEAEALLLFNNWNNRYLTSTWCPGWTENNSGLRYAMITTDMEAPIVYEQGEIGYHTKEVAPWLQEVKYAITGAGWIGRTMGKGAHEMQRDKLVQQIANDLEEYGDPNETLALDFWDPGLIEGFENEGIDVTPIGSDIMSQARRIKNEDEIECLRTVCRIGDVQFYNVAQALEPGVKESDLVGVAHQTAYDYGAKVYSGIFATSGPHSWPNPRHTTDRIIGPHETMFMDVYKTSWNGYKSCYYRTLSTGEAPEQAHEDYEVAYEWLMDAIDECKPGNTTKDVAETWPNMRHDEDHDGKWSDIDVEREDQTAGSNWAHGIGLTLYEPPIVWRAASLDHPQELEEGMTFAIETQHGTPNDYGGVRIEDVIVIRENGAEILSSWPRDEITEVPMV